MSFLVALKNMLRRGTSSLNELEITVLRALEKKLPADVQHKLDERIRRVNFVQRLDGGREVDLYVMRGGKPALDPDTSIDATPGEKLLARFRITGDELTTNAGGVWLVDGNLFSLEFENSTEHSDPAQISAISIELAQS